MTKERDIFIAQTVKIVMIKSAKYTRDKRAKHFCRSNIKIVNRKEYAKTTIESETDRC